MIVRVNKKALPVNTLEPCKYGCGEIAKFKNAAGGLMCMQSNAQCPANRKKNSNAVRKGYNSGRVAPAFGVPSWNTGLTAITSRSVAKGVATLAKSIYQGKYVPHRTLHTEQVKAAMSISKIELYASGWEPTCGRCKKYDYLSPVAGNIKVDGRWELALCYYLDAQKLTWSRNRERFNYIKSNGKSSTYQPDFYVNEWNSYIEVKGYETDLDRCKWSQFPAPLRILRKKDIEEVLEWLLVWHSM